MILFLLNLLLTLINSNLAFLDDEKILLDEKLTGVDPFSIKCYWINGYNLFELWSLRTAPDQRYLTLNN
jgi:hypothetical protein